MRDVNRPTYTRWSRRKGGFKLCPNPDCGHRHPEIMRIDGRPQRPKVCVECATPLLDKLQYPRKCAVVWYVREFDALSGETRDIACVSSEAAEELIRQRQRDYTPDPIQRGLMEQASIIIRRTTDPTQQKLMELLLGILPSIVAPDLDAGVNALIVKLGGDAATRSLRPIAWDEAIRTIVEELQVKGKSLDYTESVARTLSDFRIITGITDLTKANLESVVKYRGALVAGGWQRGGRTIGPAAGITVNRHLATLGAFFSRAVRKGWMSVNPLRGAVDEWVKVRRHRVTYMTDAELRMLIDAAPSIWMRTLLVVGYYTAARRGDLLALEWDADVDLDGSKGAGEGRAGPSIYIRGHKADTGHWVPLHPSAVDALRHLRAEPFVGRVVFPLKTTAKRLPATRVSTMFATLCRKVGLVAERRRSDGSVHVGPKFKFHDLRKKANTDLRNAGASPKERACLLGHRSVRVNEDFYEGIQPARERTFVDGLTSFGQTA